MTPRVLVACEESQPAPVKPLVLGESSLPGAMGGESEAQP